jgi:hypothetical protein
MTVLEPPDNNNDHFELTTLPADIPLEKRLTYTTRCNQIDGIANNRSRTMQQRIDMLATIAKNSVALEIGQQCMVLKMARTEFGVNIPLDGLG